MPDQSGTVTVMFTDLVGSTALGSRLGEDAAQALRRAQERILRQQFERFGGAVIKNTGDGFMMGFTSARQGVECAVEAQRAIAAQHAEGRYVEMDVRIGLHTGEPVVEGDDLHGSDVDLAARIQAEARGGQILISDVTRLLARGVAGLEFSALGERQLKGIADPVALFEVRWAEGRAARPPLTRFVGRDEEVARLQELLEAASRGQASLVLVSGEPGVGKTRLASELAIYAEDRGFQVFTGRGYEAEAMPPYLPLIEPLRQHVRSLSLEALRAELGVDAPHVARLLPELRRLLPDIADLPEMSPEGERYALFEGVSDVLLRIAAHTQLLVVLDDLHWADVGTTLLLQHLAQRLTQARLMVLGTYRDAEVDPKHPLTDLLAELTRRRLGYNIVLRPFDRGGAAVLVDAVLGQAAAPQATDAIFAVTAGNSFFTEELVRHLVEQGRDLTDQHATMGDWEIPEGVRQVVAKRLARLGDEARQLLAYCSVLGRDLSLSKAALVTGQGEDTVLDLLDEAMAAQVLRGDGEGYTFAHPLIRESLYQALSAPRRRQLHRRVYESLEALYASDPAPHLAELAYHFLEAARGGDRSSDTVNRAIDYATRAGDQAVAMVAYEEAVRLYGMALQALDLQDGPDEARRCDLLLSLGEAQIKGGDVPNAREAFQRAADLARLLQSPEKLARAALGVGGVRFEAGIVDEMVTGLLEEALRALGEADTPTRAKMLGRLAQELQWIPAHEQRITTLSREAVDMARRLGDPATLAYCLVARHWALVAPENLDERLAVADEIIRVAGDAGDRQMELEGHHWRLVDLLEIGDIPAVDAELGTASRLAEQLRQPYYLWLTAQFRAMRELLEGRFEEGGRLAQQALVLGQRVQRRTGRQAFGIQLAPILWAQGRLGELEAGSKMFVFRYPTMPSWRAGLAWIYADIGREADARTEFEYLAADDFGGLPRESGVWLIGMANLAQVCAFLRDADRARILYRLLLPYAGRNVVVGDGTVCFGSVSHYLGLLASTSGCWEDAERQFQHALEMNEKMGARPFVAYTQYAYGQMLVQRGRPIDNEKALAFLDQALSTAEQMGMKALADKILGLRPEADGAAHSDE